MKDRITSLAAYRAKKAATVEAEVTTLPLEVTLEGGGAKLIGPLESARYQTAAGWINVTFEAEGGSPDAEVRVYRLPQHV